ncbi:MAG: hypothetical protein GX595_03875, partial [Lentisphaerae bacterium]|nr:hypothetical protein [Lentisphaerota bacterium]
MGDRGRMIALEIAASRVEAVPCLDLRLDLGAHHDPGRSLRAVLPGADGALRAAAAAVWADLAAACGQSALPEAADRPFTDWSTLPGPLLAMGHPGCHGLLRRLFHLGCLDESDWPESGFTLKLVADPFGCGRHVLALCARHPDGLRAGGERLRSALRRDSAGWFWDEPWYVVPPRQGLPDPEAFAREHGSPGADFCGHPAGPLTALGHLVATGDEAWARAFITTLRPFAEGRVVLSFWRMSAVDFWTDRVVQGWQRVEHLPWFSQDDRRMVARFILACTRYCHDSLTYQKWSVTDADLMIFNHHTFPALGLFFGAGYLQRRGLAPADLTAAWTAKAWRVVERATRAGRSYDEGGAGYSWLVGVHVLRIMLARGDTSYAASDRLRRYADLAVMVQNSTLHMVPFGDCGGYTARGGGAGALLRQAAAWTGEMGYAWVAAQAEPGEASRSFFLPDRPMAPPQHHVGLFRLPMDPVIHAWAGRPAFPGYPPPLRSPNVPPEDGFDKISLRGGWAPDDDYILLQGFGAGQHGHPDANTISQYQWRQRLWLVDCDYIRRGPAQHNTIAVIRDGRQDVPPVTARCDQASTFPGGALVRSTLPDTNGCDWERTLLWLQDDCLVVADTLTARQAGDYDLRCTWRTLGAAEATPDGLRITQEGASCWIAETTASARELTTEPPPLNTVDYPPYPYGDSAPKVLCERRLLRLQAGQRVAFVNLVCPGLGGACRRRLAWSDGRLRLEGEGPAIDLVADGLRRDGVTLLAADLTGLMAALAAPSPAGLVTRSVPSRPAAGARAVRLSAPASALAAHADGWLCGCDDGTVVRIGADGTTTPVGQAGGAVRCLLSGRLHGENATSILAGSDDAQVQAWSAPGQRRWAVTLPRNHYMPARVQGLALADLDGDGRLWPIAGTAAWR